MQQGWIKLHRCLMESRTFSSLTAIQQIIAIYIILKANHEDGVWIDKYKNIEVEIKRGQLITSRNKIANEWFKGDKDVTEQKIRTTLAKLEKLQFLTMQPTKHYTLIEVLNYNVYQALKDEGNQQDNQVLTNSQPSTNQALTTNKNDKNKKNDKNEKKKELYAEFVSLTNEEYEKLVKEYGELNVQEMIKVLDNYKGANGKKYKSDYRAILNWVAEKVMSKGGKRIGTSSQTPSEEQYQLPF